MNKHLSTAGLIGFGRIRSVLAFRHQSPIARLVSAIAAFAIAMLLVGANIVPAQAASPCPTPGNFEIDGDMAQNTCTPAADDWNTPSLTVAQTTQGGTYKTAGKDDSDPSGWQSSGSTPDKTDFERAYATSRVINNHYFVYVAWERTNTTGTQGYAIEIDNAAANTGADGTPQPNRSHGTAVVYISSQGSAAPAFDGACTFTSQSNYGQTCTNSNANVTFAINTATIADPLAGTNQPAGSFFEVALDVTGLTGITPSCPGAAANSVYLRSITGQTHNGNLKGYMAPLTVAPDSTCATPTITTQTQTNPQIDGLDVVAPGTAQHDVATVTGTQAHPAPTGSVAFWLCGPTGSPADCTTGGVSGGSNPLIQHASNSTAQSDDVSPTVPGVYCWRAAFTPNPVNDNNPFLAATATTKTNECFRVAHASPSIATQIAVTGAHSPGLGFTTLGDSAQLSGFVGSVTGTVTFDLYGPYAAGVTPTCTGAPVFSTTGSVDASGHATTSSTFPPTVAGKYVWVASYGGDAINDPIAGHCSDANESATIVAAQIDVTKSANPAGSVSAGSTIGFDITVTNGGSVPAKGVHVTDNLPAGADGVSGGDLDWSLSPAYTGCAISGAVGNEVLTCDFSQVDGPGSLTAIHITAPTTPADCGTVKNKASVSTTNGTGGDSDFANVIVQCASLTLTKTADAASVNAGSQIGFTVTASNSGAGTATGVAISDPLPAGSGVDWSVESGAGNCTISGAVGSETLNCTAVTLAPGASETVHVISGTSFASCGTYPNEASLTATNHPSLKANASTAVKCPAVTLTKTADAASVNAGSQIGFTVTATNSGAAGTGTATGVAISDPLPSGSGVDWSVESGAGNCTISGAVGSETLNCTAVSLAPGASETVHVISATSFASCGTYPNEASLTATNHPSLKANASTAVKCPAVTLTKTADAASVNAGSQIGFTVTATNSGAAGTGTATGVAISDPLPAGSGVDWSVESGAGNCTISGAVGSETLNCTAVTLAPGVSETVHVVSGTSFASCGTYPNEASLTATNHPSLKANASTAVNCPDVTLTKTADAASVNAGSQIGFTVTATNSGAGTATGVAISDPLPSGSGVDWSVESGAGNCTISGAVGSETLNCTAVSLASGVSETVHVISGTSSASCKSYPNEASLTATNHPSLKANASTAVNCPGLNLTKTADAASVNAGQQIGFTVTASNSNDPGTGTATGVAISDPLPSGSGVDWSVESGAGNCTISGAVGSETLNCTAVSLAPGASETVHVISATSFASCGTYPNEASLTATNSPSLKASASTTVKCPDVTLTKTADDTSVSAGSQIGFTITATNSGAVGTGDATGLVIDDLLPAGSGVNWSVDTGPGTCTIDGSPASQTLHCTGVTLAPGVSESVHVVSGTSFVSCQAYPNTAHLTASNHPSLTANATTTVLCPDVSLTKTADAASVSAGSQIGFTVTASNSDAENVGDAKGVVIDDPLPGGAGVDWSIESGPQNCSIQGSPSNETLHCTAVDLAPGVSESVHVVSGTSSASCQAYPNEASLTATNHPPLTASATTTVLCPDVSFTKTADAALVTAGQQIGFTVTAANGSAAGTGTATGVVINDPLPGGAGVDWSIASGPENCSIQGSPSNETLHCTAVDLAPGASESVHVVSGTSTASCAVYPNTASLTVGNAAGLTASASTQVSCPIVSPPKQQPHPHVLPNTGGPNGWVFAGGLALLVAGGSLVLTDTRRRRRS
ncbi:putative repeat protein (TIGR01451 family)/LPXTG-motif cell wall-anchored protein [Marmoricola sp. URHA0025 HA25]